LRRFIDTAAQNAVRERIVRGFAEYDGAAGAIAAAPGRKSCRLTHTLGLDRETALDLTQETFLKLYRAVS